jgi:hypothetical protein
MELWIVIALLLIALVTTLLVLVRQIRLQRALRRLLTRLLNLWRTRYAAHRPVPSATAAPDPVGRL